ncbi:MAG: PilT/PilU family type 4a pilus ATPase [Desulfosalsimonas sp.]
MDGNSDQKNSGTSSGRGAKKRLGELLVTGGLISQAQLDEALKRQSQVDEHLGSILLELGYLTMEQLLDFLSSQFGVPAVNLFDMDIDPGIAAMIAPERIKEKKILPVSVTGGRLTLAMVDPGDLSTISELEFRLGKKIDPVVVPSFMMDNVIEALIAGSSGKIIGKDIERRSAFAKEEGRSGVKIDSLLRKAAEVNASDLILIAGAPPSLRLANTLRRLAAPPLTPADCENFASEMMSGEVWSVFEEQNEVDFSVTYPDISRFRVNAYRQRGSVALAIRPIIESIPPASELNLPAWFMDFALRPTGLIMVSGPAGHGKSTTLYAMVDMINNNKRSNIISLEDPVEYLHKHKKSNISQREVGRDTPSFYSGLKSVLRQAPDVIVIGEMRDRESFEIALQASYTGHLVMTTMHAANSTVAIENIIQMFEPHRQHLIRMMLADAMIVSVAQRLVPLKDGSGRILAMERLINSSRIKNIIREGKTHQIRSQMQQGTEDFTSIDIELARLCKKGRITLEDGMIYASDALYFSDLARTK